MKVESKPEVSHHAFADQLLNLLKSGIHSDVTFIIGEQNDEIKAHKCILSSRSSYFEAMFRPNGMMESNKGKIIIPQHDRNSFHRMLQFIYSGNVEDLESHSSSDIISLLEMAHEYLLVDLGLLCEHAASKTVNMDNIGKFMLLCARYECVHLRTACKRFVSENGNLLRQDSSFRQEIEQSPELGLLILDAMQEAESFKTALNSFKRRRITGDNHTVTVTEHELVPGIPTNANTIAPNVGGVENW